MIQALYLDSSAIVKLVMREAESDVLRRHLRGRQPLVSSSLARTEVLRAAVGHGAEIVSRARAVLARMEMIHMTDEVLDAAGALLPLRLRSLDAIHLATACALARDLLELVSYDLRMLEAARGLGLKVSTPS